MRPARSSTRDGVGAALVIALVIATPSTCAASESPPLGPVFSPVPVAFTSTTGLVTLVDRSSFRCLETTTFEGVAGGPVPGTNYDGILMFPMAHFAERFVGQTQGVSGNFDIVTGSPSDPLTLAVGLPGQNLNVQDAGNPFLTGLGPVGFPDFNAIGEGAIAMYFPVGQSLFGLLEVGSNGTPATYHFYRSDGSLIDTIVAGGGCCRVVFQRVGGIPDIAGVLIVNEDFGGLGIDSICFGFTVTPTRATTWGQMKALYR